MTPRRVILTTSAPWSPNELRRLSGDPFWLLLRLDHQMSPGGSQETHFDYFRAQRSGLRARDSELRTQGTGSELRAQGSELGTLGRQMRPGAKEVHTR